MRIHTLFASLLASGAMMAQTPMVKPVVLKTPTEYYIQNASPNGKWACGVFLDFGNNTYAFRWNLESGEIELLDAANESYAYDVSDNGIVVGRYTDLTYNANGAPKEMAGYWKDGKWNRLEMPSDESVVKAGASSISADGHYITGNVQIGELLYNGYVWKDGKIEKQLRGTEIVMPYDISDDGQYVTGWFQRSNRTAGLWYPDNTVKVLSNLESPFSHGAKFSPDSKKLLFWGGWAMVGGTEEKPIWGLPCIFDIASSEITGSVECIDSLANFDPCDISDKGTVVGQNNLAYIWQDGKAWDAPTYLTAKGVDMKEEHVFLYPETNQYQIYYGLSVSADDNVMGFRYYKDQEDEDTTILTKSMVVKFNQPTTGLCPASVKAEQISGLSSVLLQWKPNVSAQDIKGYNVYRDGVKINSELVTNEYLIDNVANGNYSYTVTAVYGDKESDKSDEVSVKVSTGNISKPMNVVAQQHGYNSAYIAWDAPESNFSTLTYFDRTKDQAQGFGVQEPGITYENAIRFNGATIEAYKGKQLSAVNFYPMSEQKNWKVNVYTLDDNGNLKLLYSQPITQKLNYGVKNTVKLDKPVAVPDDELLVAIQVEVATQSVNITGMAYGKCTDEYSDLIREVGEDESFYSINAATKEQHYMYPVSWAIEAVVTDGKADLKADDIDFYEVYVDGKQAKCTNDLEYTATNLSAGKHTFGVKAVYGNGVKSDLVEAPVDITTDNSRLVGVDKVGIDHKSDTQITAFWSAPKDNDATTLQYCDETPSNQHPVGSTTEAYDMMISSIYPSSMFKGRSGYNITSARFYPLSDATYTIYVYEGNEIVNETEVESVKTGQWNEVKLSEPIAVKANATYRLAIDCYDLEPGAPVMAVDKTTAVSGYSNLYSQNGGTSWNPLSTTSIESSWMMGLNIENTNPLPLPVAGYDVTIDGKKQNTEMLTKNTFDYTFDAEDAKQHTIQVDVYYTVDPQKSVKGSVNTFYIGTAGIADNTVGVISLVQGDNQITVQGNNVTSVALVAANGATVAEAAGNTVAINGVAAGVYMVKAVVDGETVVRKVQIK